MKKTAFGTAIALLTFFLFFSGCSPVLPPDGSVERYAGIMARYSGTDDQLRTPKLKADAALTFSRAHGSPDVFIIVHPGYSFFFTQGKKERYGGAKFRMMELQFESEARFIDEQARSGAIVILIVPGNYDSDSKSPLAYTSYLNTAASAGRSVFYIPSETSRNGTIAADDMLNLYRFLQAVRTRKVLIGGGYIGRCQKEFYVQFTTYYDHMQTYIVREISTVSPEDVSGKDAESIADGIQRQDFALVGRFIAEKLGDDVNVLSIPPRRAH